MYIPVYITLKSTFYMMDIANMYNSLDAKEPSIKNHIYARRHNLEVYILDGGYWKYVQDFGS
jgi:hypothetical protein